MNIVDLITAAHQAARAGRIDEAHEHMVRIRPYAEINSDVRAAYGMLQLLIGDAAGAATLGAVQDRDVAMALAAQPRTIEDGLEPDVPHVVSYQESRREKCRHTELLAAGNFQEAGAEFMHIADACTPVQLGAPLLKTRTKMLPRWGGGHVAHLVVVCAAGLGDVFLFGRYFAALTDRASRVTLVVHRPLVSLLRNSLPAEIAVVAHQACAGSFAEADAYTDHVLLPLVLGTRYGEAAWIRPREVAKPDGRGPHVGICWNGGMSNPNDRLRSIPIELLAPLLTVRGVTWHSLQVGPKAAECPAGVVNRAPNIKNFQDTADIIAGLDLVVTIDSAVANLCGAMGAPVAVLVEHENDFRWGTTGDTTPWYPSARVFRQDKVSEWAAVVERVRTTMPYTTATEGLCE